MAEPIREIETDVLVVGGATAGTSVARSELCMRGVVAELCLPRIHIVNPCG
jgi:glycerol-3-phosphate dehydrogenase